MGFHLISRLRDDSVLYYLDPVAPVKKRRGRRRKWDGKVDTNNLKKSKMEKMGIEEEGASAYTAVVFCHALECKVRLVVYYPPKGGAKLFFSTDIDMSGKDVFDYYRTRFQIEFCFRDSKQITGLSDSQTRDENRLDFAFNASLTATNVAKVLCAEIGVEYSIGKLKALMTNLHFAQRIIRMCGIRPNMGLILKLNKHILELPETAA